MVHRRVAAANRGWLIAAYGSPNGAASQPFAMAARPALADALAPLDVLGAVLNTVRHGRNSARHGRDTLRLLLVGLRRIDGMKESYVDI